MSGANHVSNQQDNIETPMSIEELVKLAETKGVELTDDQMQKISGGAVWDDEPTQHSTTCDWCGKKLHWYSDQGRPNRCPYCGCEFNWA